MCTDVPEVERKIFECRTNDSEDAIKTLVEKFLEKLTPISKKSFEIP